MNKYAAIAIGSALIITVIVGTFLLTRHNDEGVELPLATQDQSPTVDTESPATDETASLETAVETDQTETTPELVPPPEKLDGSDRAVLELANSLSPQLVTWLLPEEQIRKWVMTIDLLADGKIPRRYQPVEFSMAPFNVDKSNGTVTANESNYTRAEPLIKAITAIDPAVVVEYLQHWQPLTSSAYKELGKPGNFNERLSEAINNVLNARPLPKNATLDQPLVFYVYEDQELENASDIQKLLWRIGPDNTALIQDYLRKVHEHLQ